MANRQHRGQHGGIVSHPIITAICVVTLATSITVAAMAERWWPDQAGALHGMRNDDGVAACDVRGHLMRIDDTRKAVRKVCAWMAVAALLGLLVAA